VGLYLTFPPLSTMITPRRGTEKGREVGRGGFRGIMSICTIYSPSPWSSHGSVINHIQCLVGGAHIQKRAREEHAPHPNSKKTDIEKSVLQYRFFDYPDNQLLASHRTIRCVHFSLSLPQKIRCRTPIIRLHTLV